MTDYNGIGKIQYLLGLRGISAGQVDYGEQVTALVNIPYEDKDAVINEITEATAGKAKISVSGTIYFKK